MAFWNRMTAWVPGWLEAVVVFALILAAGFTVQRLITQFLNTHRASRHPFLLHAWSRTHRLVRFMLGLFAAGMAVQLLNLTGVQLDIARKAFLCLFIIQLGWIVIVIANIAMDRYVYGLKLDVADNLMARKAVTQMGIMRHAVNILLALLTAGFALMSFDSVRQFGVSLFASAGIAGIVAGLAARPLFENLIAGLQLAFTQPLRLGDAVVINNEFGTVEEIGSVYIVIRLWDWRRQIVPLSYVFTTPFVNWTRSSSAILGSVMFFFDYTLDVAALRAEAERLVKSSDLWDGNVFNLQVVDATDTALKVRILTSAANSGKSSDLAAFLRENLIAHVRDKYPMSLPRSRQEPTSLPRTPGECRDPASIVPEPR